MYMQKYKNFLPDSTNKLNTRLRSYLDPTPLMRSIGDNERLSLAGFKLGAGNPPIRELQNHFVTFLL